METVLYELGFDYSEAMGGLIPIAMGVVVFWLGAFIGKIPMRNTASNLRIKEISHKGVAIVLKVIGVIAFIGSLFFYSLYIDEYNQHKTKLENGEVLIVEGYVENFRPLLFFEKGTENFEINGVYFAYNDAGATNGYNTTADRGGVITGNGQHLRIKYISNEDGENIILYIAEIE